MYVIEEHTGDAKVKYRKRITQQVVEAKQKDMISNRL